MGKSTTEAANPNQPPVVHISEKIVNELTSLKETTKLNHAMSEDEKKWALLLLGTAIERIYNVFASEDEILIKKEEEPYYNENFKSE